MNTPDEIEALAMINMGAKTPGQLEDKYLTETFHELPELPKVATTLTQEVLEALLRESYEDSRWRHLSIGPRGTSEPEETVETVETSNPVNPKKAYGALKAPMGLVPSSALIELNAVMAGGAHKYGPYNFRESPVDAMTYLGAIQRHFMLWEDGVDFDDESQRHHLAHVMACCSILIDAHYTGKFLDNRSKTGNVEPLLKSAANSHNDYIETVETKVTSIPTKAEYAQLVSNL